MIQETETLKEKDFEALFAQVKEPSLLREKCWDHFLELGAPRKAQDAFHYVPLRKFYENSFVQASDLTLSKEDLSSFIYPECQNSCLVFLNGVFSKELSQVRGLPKQVIVLSLKEALRSYGSFINLRISNHLKEDDALCALNAALYPEGAFVFVPAKVEIETPLQCLYIMQGGAEGLAVISPRMHIFMGKGSKMRYIESSNALSNDPFWVNGCVDAVLEEGSSLERISLSHSLPKAAWQFSSLRALLKKESRFFSVTASAALNAAREDIRVNLSEEQASCELYGIGMLQGLQETHTNIRVDHMGPNTRSLQRYKSVLKDFSKTSFQGKIYVDKIAQKTEAYQLNNNLVLGDRAIANSRPNLEIFADDVKASHGATISQLDEASLFYLKARGITQEMANDLLVRGFCKEILDLIPAPIVARAGHG